MAFAVLWPDSSTYLLAKIKFKVLLQNSQPESTFSHCTQPMHEFSKITVIWEVPHYDCNSNIERGI